MARLDKIEKSIERCYNPESIPSRVQIETPDIAKTPPPLPQMIDDMVQEPENAMLDDWYFYTQPTSYPGTLSTTYATQPTSYPGTLSTTYVSAGTQPTSYPGTLSTTYVSAGTQPTSYPGTLSTTYVSAGTQPTSYPGTLSITCVSAGTQPTSYPGTLSTTYASAGTQPTSYPGTLSTTYASAGTQPTSYPGIQSTATFMGAIYQQNANQLLPQAHTALAASIGMSMERISSVRISSCSRKNFCARMIKYLFTTEEMKTSNVSGKTTGAIVKKPLDPAKIGVIKKMAYIFWPLETNEKENNSWKDCIKAIDEVCRRQNRSDRN